MSSRLPSRPGSVPEYIFCDDGKSAKSASDAGAAPLSLAPAARASGLVMSLHASCQVPRDRRDIAVLGVTDAGPFLVSTGASPERRCSSRTFRYGYLVTT